jgi:hypothetical protein
VSKTICHSLIAGLLLAVATARGDGSPAKFLGANSCASTGCHGGGGAKQNQFLTWSLKDFHSQRPTATLTTARSKQIADALEIKDPTADVRCTSCHAPLHDVPENLRGETFKVSEGVSCESCHGPAEKWLRAHTRPDYTRADRAAAGMRDLQNLYVRANTCVACHQNVDNAILKAGHPELIFELDGQSVAEPKHWQEATNWNGAQAWMLGQFVALREMSPQLTNEKSPSEQLKERWTGLAWLVQQWMVSNTSRKDPVFASENIKGIQEASDYAARCLAQPSEQSLDEIPKSTREILIKLAATFPAFKETDTARAVQARRAERLVLALDRLVTALPELKDNAPVQSALNQLFTLAQSVPDFDPKQFAAALEKFSTALAAQ